MPFFRPVKSKKRSKHYDKVSHKVKILLLKKILCDHRQIKEVADELAINYSTAKTLMRKYHRCGNDMNLQVLQGICNWYEEYEDGQKPRCSYRVIQIHSFTQKKHQSQQSGIESEALEKQQPPTNKNDYEVQKIELLQHVLFRG